MILSRKSLTLVSRDKESTKELKAKLSEKAGSSLYAGVVIAAINAAAERAQAPAAERAAET
jgi:hypothetical protein